MPTPQPAMFDIAPPGLKIARVDDIDRDLIGNLAGQPKAIAGDRGPRLAKPQMPAHMVSGQDAVAVQEKQVWGRARTYTVVATAGELETIVRMRGQQRGKARLGREFIDDSEGLLVRPIVGDDHLGRRFQSLLARDRRKAATQVFRLVVRRN
jgi:hypothetical protein